MCATNSFREGRVECSTMGTTRVGNHGAYLYSFAFDTTARKQAAHSQPRALYAEFEVRNG